MNALKVLSELVPGIPIIVLAHKNDVELARTAIRHGAEGYIPCTMEFEIAVEAVRLVLSGGTYVPMDIALCPRGVQVSSISSHDVTPRELEVTRAIQEGMSNKAIAYQLSQSQNTVKIHVSSVKKKLNARNRTEVAIKARSALALSERRNSSRM